ncbi:MAG: PQQ-binding-like beta-propeller repeat protein [Actinomycetota bacterium]|nr:PQQ-binding-like beta-propeller repeat protein [Actinomycetota bacterium]
MLKWEFYAGDGVSTCPFVFSPTIGKDGLLYASTSKAKIHCVDSNDGTEKWQFAAESPGPGGHPHNFMPPAIDKDGTIYATLLLGRIYAIGAGS